MNPPRHGRARSQPITAAGRYDVSAYVTSRVTGHILTEGRRTGWRRCQAPDGRKRRLSCCAVVVDAENRRCIPHGGVASNLRAGLRNCERVFSFFSIQGANFLIG